MTPRPRPSRALFVLAYLARPNATEAAVAAGYSPRTARSQGCRLLTKVDISAPIAAARAIQTERLEVDAAGVVDALWTIANANLGDIVAFGHEGMRLVNPWHPSMAGVREMEIEERVDGSLWVRRVAMHDKIAALRLLMVHFGMLPPIRGRPSNERTGRAARECSLTIHRPHQKHDRRRQKTGETTRAEAPER